MKKNKIKSKLKRTIFGHEDLDSNQKPTQLLLEAMMKKKYPTPPCLDR